MKSLAGHLLIASPDLTNDFFEKTVVLVFQHSEEGAAGVILNKPSHISVGGDLANLGDHANSESVDSLTINIGGPCEGPLIALHNSLAFAEVPVIPGVALTVGIDNLKKLLRQKHQTVRLFSGYSGWASNQLDAEMERGGWFALPARTKYVFGDPVDMWRIACGEFGDEIVTPLAGEHVPSDPSLN